MALTILGTSHIAKESVRQIKEFIKENKPDIIAVELDNKRLPSLFSKEKRKNSISSILRIGVQGYLFMILASWASKKLGNIANMQPGADMKEAIRQARKNKLRLYLIDQDIEVTLRRFSQVFSWKEKLRIIKEIFAGIINKEGAKEDAMKRFRNIDLRKVPSDELINLLILEMKEKYPNIYKVLITERNRVMVKNLEKIMLDNPGSSVLAVVGAGHKEGMEELLRKRDRIRISEKKIKKSKEEAEEEKIDMSNSYSYSFTQSFLRI